MKYNKLWKRTGALTLALAVIGNGFGSGPMVGLAAEAGATPISTYSAEEMSRFADNTLEYWEIPGLIEYYNPSYLNSLEQFYYNPGSSTGLTRDQLLETAKELRNEAKELEYELEDQVDSGILEKNSYGYLDYKDNIKTLKRYAKEMEEAAQGNASTKHVLRMARNQQIVKISEMMRAYQMLVSQNEVQKKQLEIAAGSCDMVRRQVNLGMCSAADLRAAEQAVAVQQALVDASNAELAQKKSELIVSMGWSRDGNPEILKVPEPDLTKIASYDLAADMQKAIDNNYDIIDIRKTDSSKYGKSTGMSGGSGKSQTMDVTESGGAKTKQEDIETAEKSVKMQFEVLYKNVLSQEEAYQGAQTGWEAAEKKKALAERKWSLGMISRLEYLQAEAEWLSAKASGEQAALNLTAAMETYEWAMKGLIKQSSGM